MVPSRVEDRRIEDADEAPRLRIMHLALDDDTSGFFPQLAKHYGRKRFEMYFGTLKSITPSFRGQLAAQNVPVVELGARSRLSYPAAACRLASALRKNRIDILHTHLFDPSVVGLPVAAALRTRLRVMTRHYSDYHTRIDKKWHTRLDRMCTAFCHGVIAISHETKRVMVEEEGASASKIRVIHNGIDFDRVKEPPREEVLRFHREFGLEGRPVLCILGRLHPEKGYEHLFQAMTILNKTTKGRIRLLVAGTGPLRRGYERLVEQLGLRDNVIFLGYRSDAPVIMSAADIFVLPSVAEGFGLVLAEAMALGKPIVASRVGGIPEVVEEGVHAVLVPPADPETLAREIGGLLRDPARAAAMGAAGPSRAKMFDFRTMMREYEEYYLFLMRVSTPPFDRQGPRRGN